MIYLSTVVLSGLLWFLCDFCVVRRCILKLNDVFVTLNTIFACSRDILNHRVSGNY